MLMKTILSLVIAGLMLLVLPVNSVAGIVWSNGSITGPGTHCDYTGGASCSGADGFTIADNFNLSGEIIVSGFTYDSTFNTGSVADYLSTNWTIYDGDPYIFQTGVLVASGNAVATTASDSCPACSATTFTVTGLSIDLPAGEYWLAYENVLTGSAGTVDDVSAGNGLPGFDQLDDSNSGGDSQYDSGDTVFTVEGDAPPATPEPASLWLAALTGGACLVKSRIRLPRHPGHSVRPDARG